MSKHVIEVRIVASHWRLFVNGHGIATWPSGVAVETPFAYAQEVARCLAQALQVTVDEEGQAWTKHLSECDLKTGAARGVPGVRWSYEYSPDSERDE